MGDGGADGGFVDAGPLTMGDGGRVDAGPWFVASVVAFDAGVGGGRGSALLPDIVQGPPYGGGELQGSLDTLSLGRGGVITLELGIDVVDGPGVDLLVFENAFRTGESVYAEWAEVSLSPDAGFWVTFPCDPDAGVVQGCAGWHPVFASPERGIDARDPAVAGGDPFNLADVALSRARFVRIRDLALTGGAPPSAGFDLDAISVVNAAP